LSYFAKPHYIPYDKWFDDDLEKDEIPFINKKRKDLSTIHHFFYRQSKNKIGASENLLNLDTEEKSKPKSIKYSSYNFPENYFLISKAKDNFFKKVSKNELKFGISKYFFYSLWIIGFSIIFGSILFFISTTRESESKNINKFLEIQKEF
tara:strand:- start:538 stop:987 length:450 start_codon:yes stop_codon:yes gene_type:complete